MTRWLILIAVVIAALAAALGMNTITIDSAVRAAAPRDGGGIVDTDVVAANVRVEGEGAPIVLIHGFAAAIDWWDDIAPALAADHRVIRLDLIGHGGTAAPASGYSIERQAQLVAVALDKLGVDRVTVIGHSMGGEVATALAVMNPARIERMILIDSPPTADTTFTPLTGATLSPVLGQALWRMRSDAAVRLGLAQGFAKGFPVPEQFVSDFDQLTYTAFRSAHDASVAYRTEKPTYARLAALGPVPKLLAIFGALDAIVPAATAKFYEQVPGAKVETIDGVGDPPMVEAPDKTLALIRAFLAPAP